MSKDVLLAAFQKAEKEIGSSKKTHRSKHISDALWNNFKFQIDERTLRDYYNSYINKSGKELKPIVTKHLCLYIGFKSYEDFLLSNKPQTTLDQKKTIEEKKYTQNASGNSIDLMPKSYWIKSLVIISFISLLGLLSYWAITQLQDKCMIWSSNHYEEVSCNDSNPLSTVYNKELLENFKKVQLDTTQTLFQNGHPNYWYDISDKKIEFFTRPGIHPINGKELKPLTQTIVRKYIYNEKTNDNP